MKPPLHSQSILFADGGNGSHSSPPRAMLSHGDLEPPKSAAASTHGLLLMAAFLRRHGDSSVLTGEEGCCSGLCLGCISWSLPGHEADSNATLSRAHSDHSWSRISQRVLQVSREEMYSTSFSMSREKRSCSAASRGWLIVHLPWWDPVRLT